MLRQSGTNATIARATHSDTPNSPETNKRFGANKGKAGGETASGESQALQLLRKRKFDAVLTDMCMENDQSGREIVNEAARIRSRPVIIVFTGFGTVENRRAVLGSKADCIALKPVDMDGLKHTLARCLLRGLTERLPHLYARWTSRAERA